MYSRAVRLFYCLVNGNSLDSVEPINYYVIELVNDYSREAKQEEKSMAYNGFAIDKYLDADAVNAQLDKLIKSPVYGVLPDALAEYEREYFEKKCARSKAEISEARNIIPGGVQHNLAFNYPFPIVITKADGAKLWDIDGNEYYDLLQAGGQARKEDLRSGTVGRDVPHAGIGHRGRHGGSKSRQAQDGKQEHTQDGRSLSRMVRHAVLRNKDTGN